METLATSTRLHECFPFFKKSNELQQYPTANAKRNSWDKCIILKSFELFTRFTQTPIRFTKGATHLPKFRMEGSGTSSHCQAGRMSKTTAWDKTSTLPGV